MPPSLMRYLRRRWRGTRFIIVLSVFVISILAFWGQQSLSRDPFREKGKHFDVDSRSLHRKLLQSTDSLENVTTPALATTRKSQYPEDIFSLGELKDGAVLLYVVGVLYMFVALAIVCDEFFVPALEVITVKLAISADVAGATFMAAGGSAPELFTSLIGTFAAFSEVGIGTIVGSAVFNILFVIGMCAIVSSEILALTWWPLFRDVTFYSISLICLIGFFNDGFIQWWEALVLFLCYVAYVIFMKFNAVIEEFVKSKMQRNRVQNVRSTDNLIASETGQPVQQVVPEERTKEGMPVLKGSSKFRHGVLQLMIHTIDPLGESKVHEKALKLHAVASLKVIMSEAAQQAAQNAAAENHNDTHQHNHNNGVRNGTIPAISNGQVFSYSDPARTNSQQTSSTTVGSIAGEPVTTREVVMKNTAIDNDLEETNSSQANSETRSPEPTIEEPEDENEPLDLSWPTTCRRRLTYILLAPIIFPLWLTLPDVRRHDKEKFFPWTFVGSILWIAGFSYLMNWWASVIGKTIPIDESIMGLTVLAAGTSIPDLITSIIVAKKGFGDMAVSSSVGSNIFDVTVGLPVPWMLYHAIYGKPYSVDSKGLFCSILLLFTMLTGVIVMIALFRWQLNKKMGILMLLLYASFLTLAVLLELGKIPCPVTSGSSSQ